MPDSYSGRHRLFDAKRRDGWSFVRAPGGWCHQWRGPIKISKSLLGGNDD